MAAAEVLSSDVFESPERFVVLANPVSANARDVDRQVRELQNDAPMPVVAVETEMEPTATREKLSKVLQPGDWLGIGAGDGTVNFAINSILLEDEFEDMRRLPIAPFHGGTASDLAHMLQNREALKRTSEILESGRVVPVTPLQAKVSTPDGRRATVAAGYMSFGASARAAHEIDAAHESPLYKTALGKLYVGAVATKGALLAPEYELEDEEGQHKRFEHMFINGGRLGGITHWNVELTEPGAQEIIIPEKRIIKAALMAGRSIFGQLRGKEFSPEDERAFTLKDKTWMQYDGETTGLEAGSHVAVGLSPEPFYAVTTKRQTEAA